MRDFKTTLVGAVSAGIIAVLSIVQNGGRPDAKSLVIAFALALIGYFAKDAGDPPVKIPQ